jgi:drug/metabolite transporter (DMT)-like permease
VPALSEIHLFVAMGCISALSHILSIAAFRYSEASTLAPLVYLELVAASVIGYVFFDEIPDLAIWIGAGVIIASGLLLIQSPKSKADK